ncbi:GM11495 [Drosophila sechellia]|uniref:GM11495 n=1 Tax=Drosophila sechellia TaxID=7238 RepID=B4IGS0_DROSE|nr:GM11495 [Drosophila sechellia]
MSSGRSREGPAVAEEAARWRADPVAVAAAVAVAPVLEAVEGLAMAAVAIVQQRFKKSTSYVSKLCGCLQPAPTSPTNHPPSHHPSSLVQLQHQQQATATKTNCNNSFYFYYYYYYYYKNIWQPVNKLISRLKSLL